jgi:quercetin dioxygenase-like cupin family protein
MESRINALSKGEGPAVWFFNTLAVVKATAKHTANAFALIEQLAPAGLATPYHIHRAEDEAFHVLEGQLEFISGEQRLTGGPGSYVFLPRDVPHGFRVLGASPARFLVLTTPAGFEGFVMEMGQPASALTLPAPSALDLDRLTAVAARYRIEILGPVPEQVGRAWRPPVPAEGEER